MRWIQDRFRLKFFGLYFVIESKEQHLFLKRYFQNISIIKLFYLNQVFFSFKFKIESFTHSRVMNIYTQYMCVHTCICIIYIQYIHVYNIEYIYIICTHTWFIQPHAIVLSINWHIKFMILLYLYFLNYAFF